MAVKADQLKVVIKSQGGKKVSRAIDKVKRSARDASRSVGDMGDNLLSAGKDMMTLSGMSRVLRGRLEKLDDGLDSVARSAGTASTRMGMLAGSQGAAATSAVALSAAINASVVPALVLLGTALTPLVMTFGAMAAAAGSLGIALGVIVGSGVIAYGKGLQKQLKKVKKQIVPLVKQFGQKFVPLIRDAVAALPRLVKNTLKVIGPLDRFKKQLRRLGGIAMQVIPGIVDTIFRLAKAALPVFIKVVNFMRNKADPTFRAFKRAVNRLWPAIKTLTAQLVRLLPKIFKVGMRMTKFVVPALKSSARFANRLADAFLALDRNTQKLVGGILLAMPLLSKLTWVIPMVTGAATALVGGLTSIGGTLAGIGGSITALLPSLGILGTVLGGLAGPVGIVVGALTALVLGLGGLSLAAKTDMKTVKKAIRGGMKKARKFLKQGANAVKKIANGKFKKGFKQLGKTVRGVMGSVRKFLVGKSGNGGIINKMITEGVSFLKNKANKMLFAAATAAFETLKNAGKQAKIALIGKGGSGGIINNLIGGIASYLKSDAFKTLTKAASKALGEGIRAVAIDVYNGIIGKEPSIMGDMIGAIASYLKNGAYSDLKEAAKILWGAIKAAFMGLYEGLIGNSKIPQMIGDIASYLRNSAASDLAAAAGKAAGAILQSFSDMAGNLVGGAGTLIGGLVNDVKSSISNLISDVKSSFNNAIPDEISINAGFNVPQKTIPNPLGKDVTIGGGHYGINQTMNLPQLDTGGFIESAGVAMLHAGEQVVPKADVNRGGAGDGGDQYNVTVVADSEEGGRRAGKAFVNELRSRNFN